MQPDSPVSTIPQGAKMTVEDSSGLDTTEVGKMSHDIDDKKTPSDPDKPRLRQSTTTTFLVIFSTFVTMFLVALDRTIIATVRRLSAIEQASHYQSPANVTLVLQELHVKS